MGLPVYGSLPQKPRPPYKIVQEQRNGGALFHYLFKIPQKNAAADLIQWHARARANINGAALPYPYKPNAFAGKPSSNDVIEDDIDWITAQPITTK